MISAIIFDMNGVIIDDEWVHSLAFQEVLKEFNVDITEEDYNKYSLGIPADASFKNIIKAFNLDLDLTIEDLVSKEKQAYNRLIEGKMKAVPGVVKVIKKLSKKYKIALASSSKLEEVEKVLAYFKIKEYFDEIITVDDVINGKPDPEIYLLAAKRLDVPADECVVFEDAAHGVDAAKSAGMRVIAVTTNLPVEELGNADMILEDFEIE